MNRLKYPVLLLALTLFLANGLYANTTKFLSRACNFPGGAGYQKTKNQKNNFMPEPGPGTDIKPQIDRPGQKPPNGQPNQGRKPLPALGFFCPLIENDAYKEILASVNQLESEIRQIPNDCKINKEKSVDVQQMLLTQQKMQAQAMLLQQFQDNPELLEDPMQMSAFQGAIQSLTANLTGIAKNLTNNELLSDDCSKQMKKNGGVFNAISEIVFSLAPYALMAGALNPSMKATLPYVAGIVGITTVINVIKSVIEADDIDMNNKQQRYLILRAICQYENINKKIKYLELAASGRIDGVEDELESVQEELYIYENNTQFTGVIRALLAKKREILKNRVSIQEVSTHLKSYKMDRNSNVCDDRDVYAEYINSSSLLDLYNNTDEYFFFNKKFDAIRFRLSLANFKNTESDNQCDSTDSRKWFRNLKTLVQLTVNGMDEMLKKIEGELVSHAKYKEYVTNYKKAKIRVRELKSLDNAVQELKLDKSAIAKAEVHQRVKSLQQLLFGERSFYGSSPAYQWLDSRLDLFEMQKSNFGNRYYSIGSRVATYLMIRDKPKKPNNYRPMKRRIDYMRDKEFLDWTPINLEVIEEGTKMHIEMCKQLNSAWSEWVNLINYLKAAEYFCFYIDDLIVPGIDSNIKSTCNGTRNLNGMLFRDSKIDRLYNKLNSGKLPLKAQQIDSKLNELKCNDSAQDSKVFSTNNY